MTDYNITTYFAYISYYFLFWLVGIYVYYI